jgi:hypothetical protein
MDAVIPILLLGFAGLLVGGVISMARQGAPKSTVLVMGLLAAIATVAGVLWLF